VKSSKGWEHIKRSAKRPDGSTIEGSGIVARNESRGLTNFNGKLDRWPLDSDHRYGRRARRSDHRRHR
jgi:hypothetical protein